MNFKVFLKASIVVILAAMVGCTHLGSRVMPPDRISYNRAIVNSELQQLLLNIVRLRYGDTPQFLSLNNIVSQFSFQGGLAADFNRSMSPGSITTTVDVAPNVSYSESPTLTYTPMQGEEFVTRLLTPVDIQILKMFLRDGWGVARVLRTFVQRLGPMPNAILASRPTSSRAPVWKDFSEFSRILRKLQWLEGFKAFNDNSDGTYRIMVVVTAFDKLNAEERAFLKKLGVDPLTPNFWVTTVENDQPRNFYAETRTVLAIYNYLSKGVEVPKEHEKIVGRTIMPNGEVFNWNQIVEGLLDVKYARVLPIDAYVYVYYRGYYFYVIDTDNNSKETLNLLSILNGIFQGNIQSVLPVFTVS
jgi:hypothetical protein